MRKILNNNNKLPSNNGNGKNNGGRPSKYDPDTYPQKAKELSKKGFTDKQISRSLKVSEPTMNSWKDKFPEFLKSLMEGKDAFDVGVVEQTSLKKALGYDYIETSITDSERQGRTVVTHHKHMAPDSKLLIKWLEHRNRERWGKLPEEQPQQPQININILGKLSTDDIKSIREIVGRGIPAASTDTR